MPVCGCRGAAHVFLNPMSQLAEHPTPSHFFTHPPGKMASAPTSANVSDGENHTTNPENVRRAEKKQQAYRSWLLLLTSLTATVTFTVGLTPPGGFWAADDKTNGYVAGISVMRDKFPNRYFAFYYSNTTAFFTSLMIIATLARNQNNSEQPDVIEKYILRGLVVLCFLSLAASYVAGTWDSPSSVIYVVVAVFINILYMLLPWFLRRIRRWIASGTP